MQASAAELRDFAERYTAAWCSQDAARVASFYAPNGSLTVNDGDPAVGRSPITDLAQSFMTAFPNLVVSPDDLVIAGDPPAASMAPSTPGNWSGDPESGARSAIFPAY